MIPILFEENTTVFSNNGIGRLADCISCTVKEQESGIFECKFQYPVTGIHYSDIQEKRIIYCIHDDTKTEQPFEIYGRSAPNNGIVTFYAHHISYKLGNVILNPFTATSALEAMNGLKLNEINTSPFTFWTDKSVIADFEIKVPTATRAVLAGMEGSILDVFGGGDYEWDHYTVKLWNDRGQDNNVYIRYGVNIIDMTQETDNSSTFNAVAPFWFHEGMGEDDPDVLITIPGKIVRASSATSQTLRPVTLDLSDKWETAPTVQQLTDYAVAYMNQNLSWKIDETIDVNFVALWQTEDYKNVAPLQRVRIYDYVHVVHDELGVDKKLQVVEVEYNVLTERYDYMVLGAAKQSFAEVVSGIVENSIGTNLASKSFVQQAVDLASETIKGNRGGYKLEITDADGHTMETLYMDAPNVEDAVNILRIGMSGIAFSDHGYDPEYFVSAWDIDGNFNANFITSGVLNANLIKAGIISDLAGRNYWNLQTGEFSLQVVPGDSIDQAIQRAASSAGGYTLETPFTWSNNGQTANFTAVVYKGTEDITSTLDPSWFVWTLRTEDSETQVGTGKTLSLNKSQFGYGATITCTFTTYEQAALRSVDGKKLKSVDDKQLRMYAQSDEDVLVSDLPLKTAAEVDPTDKLMGIDDVEGYQVSITNFGDFLATTKYDGRYYTQTVADGLFYNKTDADARYVNVDGDTMTGQLVIDGASVGVKTDFEIGVAPSYNGFFHALDIYDTNGTEVGAVYGIYTPSDNLGVQLEVARTVADTRYVNNVRLYINGNGAKSVSVSDPDAWRTALNVVNKSGDTMTGNLVIAKETNTIFMAKNTVNDVTIGQTVPSNNVTLGHFNIADMNDWDTGGVYIVRETSDLLRATFRVRRKNANGTEIVNSLVLGIDSSGARKVIVNESAPWRAAIGAVNKAGDTMTGDLTIAKSDPAYCTVKHTGMTAKIGTPPSANTAFGAFRIMESAGNSVAWIRVEKYTSDAVVGQFAVRRANASDTMITHVLTLSITAAGARTVSVSEQAPWLTGLGAVAKAGDTMTGALNNTGAGRRFYANNTSAATEVYIEAANSSGRVTLDVNGSGNRGVWTDKGWLCFYNSSGTVSVGNATHWRNALGVNYHWVTATITVGTLAANGGEKYNQTTAYTLPSGYTACAITRFALSGSGFTRAHITQIEVDGSNIKWSVRNNSTTATGSLTLTVVVFCLATV